MNGTGFANDKLDLLIALAAMQCGKDEVDKMDRADVSGIVFSPGYERRKHRIIRKYRRRPTVRMIKRSLAIIAASLAIMASLGFVTILAVAPLRNAVWKALVEWHEDYISIRYEDPDKDTATESESGLNGSPDTESDGTQTDVSTESGTETETETYTETETTITRPTKIEEVRKPTYLPEGVVEDVLQANFSGVDIEYYLNDDWSGTFCQTLLETNEQKVDNESATVEAVKINGHIINIISSDTNDEINIVWNDGQYSYWLSMRKISVEELKKMVASVK